jgi:NADH:ubiquinone oxidoreductase subunit H
MRLCWKIFLPLTFAFVFIYIGLLFSFDGIF